MSETRKVLLKDLKEKGLNAAEENLEDIVKTMFGALKTSIKSSPNKLDDLAIPVISWVEGFLLKKIDKIDKSDNSETKPEQDPEAEKPASEDEPKV